jgi:hypothetical protein
MAQCARQQRRHLATREQRDERQSRGEIDRADDDDQ